MQFKTWSQALFFSFFLAINSLTSAYSVIFDLNGVLLKTDKIAATQQIGYWKLCRALLTGTIPGEKTMFKELNKLTALTACNKAQSSKGNQLPQVMYDWMVSQEKNKDLLLRTQKALLAKRKKIKNPLKRWHYNAKYKLIAAMARMMFAPQRFAATQKLAKDAHRLVKQLKEQGHRIYVLSNFDTESFDLLRQKYKKFFDLFDGIVTSGQAKLLKPQKEIYTYILSKYGLEGHECIFVDDQQINLDGAAQYTIDGILCKNENLTKVAQNLNDWFYQKSS